MKINCPACKTAYRIPDEKGSRPAVTVVCKKCGAKMVINGKSGATRAVSSTTAPVPELTAGREISPESRHTSSAVPHTSEPSTSKPRAPKPTDSILSMSPEYPKHRDALIIGSMILVLVAILAGVYFLTKGAERSLQKFTRNPIEYLTKLIGRSERYEICESFVRHNQRRFAQLGQELRLSPIKEEISIINGQKTATVIARVQGPKGTKNVIFRLQQRKGKWRIRHVALEIAKGRYETLYSQARQQQRGASKRPIPRGP